MRATLYVKGVKTAVGIDDRSHMGYVTHTLPGQYRSGQQQVDLRPDYKGYREIEYKSILPEDQKALVEMAKAAAVKYGFELTVIDVTREDFFYRLGIRLSGISSFPTLETDTGLKIEGNITEERIKTLLAKQ